MLKLMDHEDTDKPAQPAVADRPASFQSDLPQFYAPPEPPAVPAERPTDIAKPSRSPALIILYAFIVLVILGVLIGSLEVIQTATNTKSAASKSAGTTSQSSKSTGNNPLDPNQSSAYSSSQVSAEGQYCSNPVNAGLSC
jgi:hypothetical protein